MESHPGYRTTPTPGVCWDRPLLLPLSQGRLTLPVLLLRGSSRRKQLEIKFGHEPEKARY